MKFWKRNVLILVGITSAIPPTLFMYYLIKNTIPGPLPGVFAFVMGFTPTIFYRNISDNKKLADARIDLFWIWFAIIGGLLAYSGLSFEAVGVGTQDSIAIFLIAAGMRLAKSVGAVEEARPTPGPITKGSIEAIEKT